MLSALDALSAAWATLLVLVFVAIVGSLATGGLRVALRLSECLEHHSLRLHVSVRTLLRCW